MILQLFVVSSVCLSNRLIHKIYRCRNLDSVSNCWIFDVNIFPTICIMDRGESVSFRRENDFIGDDVSDGRRHNKSSNTFWFHGRISDLVCLFVGRRECYDVFVV